MDNFVTRFFQRLRNVVAEKITPNIWWLRGNDYATFGKKATQESSRRIHTAFRCENILSDDIASMPLQVFQRVGDRLQPAVSPRKNLSYQLEIEPNRWMNPFIFKKTIVRWLINWGQAFVWANRAEQEFVILPSDRTMQLYDGTGNIWYQVDWPSWDPHYTAGENPAFYPDIEVLKLLINSDDGLTGRSILTFARDSFERQIGAHETQKQLHAQGLNPGGILWVPGELNKDAREKLRKTYEESMSGSENAYRVAVLDNTVSKFEQITMKPSDAQFLESINATDVEIANFYGIPLYKLNLGKQSYESNAQLDLDYLKTTLNSYLEQWEAESKRKWLSLDQQVMGWYLKFNRAALLATDANTRAAYLEKKIISGQMSPNEARQIDDMPPYPGGDKRYIPANMVAITSVPVTNSGGESENQIQPKQNGNGNGHGELAGQTLRPRKGAD